MMNRVADRQREAEEVRIPVVGAAARAGAGRLAAAAGRASRSSAARRIAEQAVRDRRRRRRARHRRRTSPSGFGVSRPATVKVVADSSRSAGASDGRARAPPAAALQRRDRQPAPDRARRQPAGDRHAAAACRRSKCRPRSSARRRCWPSSRCSSSSRRSSAAMQIATDSTAGERERGSLEPLLVNPVAARRRRHRQVAGRRGDGALIGRPSPRCDCGRCCAFSRCEDMGMRFRIGPADVGQHHGRRRSRCASSAPRCSRASRRWRGRSRRRRATWAC